MVYVEAVAADGVDVQANLSVATGNHNQHLRLHNSMKFEKDHPYMIALDSALSRTYTVLKTSKITTTSPVESLIYKGANIIVFSDEEAEKDYEEMKQTILETFMNNMLPDDWDKHYNTQ
jgi:hypothetical protein